MDHLTTIRSSFTGQSAGYDAFSAAADKQRHLIETVRAVPVGPADRVLEVASGTGQFARAIAPGAKEVICLDATPAMLRRARAEAERAGIKNLSTVEGLAEALPFEAACFDVVISRLALHHFQEIEPPFAEMVRVLRPGGRLVVIDMEAAEEPLRERQDGLERSRDPSHVKNRSRRELLALFRRHGLTVARMEMTGIPVPLADWLRLTATPEQTGRAIAAALRRELSGGDATGFDPFVRDGAVWFWQRWMFFLGIRPEAADDRDR